MAKENTSDSFLHADLLQAQLATAFKHFDKGEFKEGQELINSFLDKVDPYLVEHTKRYPSQLAYLKPIAHGEFNDPSAELAAKIILTYLKNRGVEL